MPAGVGLGQPSSAAISPGAQPASQPGQQWRFSKVARRSAPLPNEDGLPDFQGQEKVIKQDPGQWFAAN